ncbi:MAG TPA: polysaccharide deacetylase family protein [Candidatus Acidoferrales bacterium]|jgi:peptidoglycan/xylan/chitin deacetylase (PgdA/CDA1 family)|nr:polysaccharide deacetylase family protein [Candidatus Acidoferrales bacterium]
MKPVLGNARRVLRWLWAGMLVTSGCLWWAKRQLRAGGAVVPLMLHRVLGEADYLRTHSLPGIVVRERTFRELVAHVVGRYEPVDLRAAEPGKPSRRIRVAFTFDDGWSDNYSVAFPITREFEVPLTVFLCPGLIDQNSPFWPETVVGLMRAVRPPAEEAEVEAVIEGLKKYATEAREQHLLKLSEQAQEQGMSIAPSDVDRTLSWAAITEMDRAGVSFGSHTLTHQILTRIPLDTARQEVRQSKTAIETALQKCCDAFAYPNGSWSTQTRHLLAEEGFQLAVTTERGAWTATCDRLAIPRSNISEDNVVGPTHRFSPTMFEYTTFWKSWRATKAKSRLEFRANQQPTPAAL